MIFCHRVFACLLPRWLSGHNQCISLEYDSCGHLYDDQRLKEVRHWDGVHMYHIAYYGYTHETLFVFFPFIPFMIRFVRWCIVRAFPLLYRLAPVSFYVSGLNIFASAGAGVVLRHLTILTMLGPETERTIQLWRRHRQGRHAGIGRGHLATVYEMDTERRSEDFKEAIPTSALCTAGTVPTLSSHHWGSIRGILQDNQYVVNLIYGVDDNHACKAAGILLNFPHAHAAAAFRVIQGYHGTVLDKLSPFLLTTSIHDTAGLTGCQTSHNVLSMFDTKDTKQGSHTYLPSLTSEAAREVVFRWRVVGGAVLVWLLTPAVVFTVANYTESFFSLFTMLGIYLLACYQPFPKTEDTKFEETEEVIICRCPYPSPRSPDRTAADGKSDCKDACLIHWKPKITSWHEVVAITCFIVSSCIRSNGFLCVGFLLYPTVLQLLFPQSYRERWEVLHGPCWASYVRHVAEKKSSKIVPQLESYKGTVRAHRDSAKPINKDVYVVRTLYTPTRFPHPLRLVILLIACALIFTPYLTMGYLGWKRYIPLWSEEERHIDSNHFWKFYNVLQRKYWNVGFLRAYTVTNSPNVLIALPIGFIVGYASYHYAIRPALCCSFCSSCSSLSGSMLQRKHPSIKMTQCVWLVLQSLVQSSNVVYLCVLCLIAFTIMHVQVVNRFVMSSPALYWLIGAQLGTKPNARLTWLILFYILVWGLTGGLLFSNFMPWT
ncbi:unnamed protein product [Phytomonas sp. EM1]|nr:unnamed protein product [Phytomonas sp. EM1]|eukprot:CCW61266.1 unnamed protein product [Phytomonas sp. isolate EM1]